MWLQSVFPLTCLGMLLELVIGVAFASVLRTVAIVAYLYVLAHLACFCAGSRASVQVCCVCCLDSTASIVRQNVFYHVVDVVFDFSSLAAYAWRALVCATRVAPQVSNVARAASPLTSPAHRMTYILSLLS